MADDFEASRNEPVSELRAALAELEGGEGLSRFTAGHGLMSRVFEFRWNEPALDIDFRLPYALVLANEEGQGAADAEIGAAIRMAILLLTAAGAKDKSFEGLRTAAWADGDGVGYSIRDGEGDTVDAGDDWTGLVRRLETALPERGEDLSIIWP